MSQSVMPPVNEALDKVVESMNVRLSAAVDTQLKRLESLGTQHITMLSRQFNTPLVHYNQAHQPTPKAQIVV